MIMFRLGLANFFFLIIEVAVLVVVCAPTDPYSAFGRFAAVPAKKGDHPLRYYHSAVEYRGYMYIFGVLGRSQRWSLVLTASRGNVQQRLFERHASV